MRVYSVIVVACVVVACRVRKRGPEKADSALSSCELIIKE